MPLIPPETIEQIAASNDIVEVISGYIPLKRAGVMWKALCPFHQERSPSFSVNPQRQIFKCFGCGAGGSVIRFVMTYENLDFISAAKKLAERAGIKIVEAEMSAEDTARYGMRRRLLALHAEAAEFFHAQLLKKPSAQIARDYLKGRGIGTEVAKAWKIGYAPDSFEAFTEFAHDEGFTPQELVESGLVKLRDEERRDGDFYDRFRNRVMFPICNDTGEVIAFSGRVLAADAKAAKYVNSPETMLFTKGAVLFGLHKSKRALIDKGSAIVMEGQLDLITAFEAGVQNVVAPQGTAFTPKQAHKLKQYVEEVVLCFDSDAAGEKAAERSLPQLLHENLVVRVAEMQPGEDPDSMIRAKGAPEFIGRITAAKDFFDFQIDRLSSRPDFATPRGKMQAARRMAEWISLITDAMLREAVMHKVSQRLEISTQELVRLFRQPARSTESSDSTASSVKLNKLVESLIFVALADKSALEWLRKQEFAAALSAEQDCELLIRILSADFDPSDTTSFSAFQSSLSSSEDALLTRIREVGAVNDTPPELRRLEKRSAAGVVEFRGTAGPKGRQRHGFEVDTLVIAADTWRSLLTRLVQRRIEELKARLRTPGLSEEQSLRLQKEVLDQQKRLSDIARPLSPPL